jgi:hypothetical protein
MISLVQYSLVPVYAKEEVVILDNHSFYISPEGTLYVVGEVQNVRDKDVQFVRITATFYDENNTVVGTNTSTSGLRMMPPGAKSPFQVSMDDENKIQKMKNYSLKINSYDGVTQPFPKTLMILSNSSYVSVAGFLNIVGEVKNNGSSESTFTRVIATCYDDNGTVVYMNTGLTVPNVLASGQNATFNLIIYDKNQSGKVTNYALQAESDEAILIPEIQLIPIALFITLLSTMVIIRQRQRKLASFFPKRK